MWSEGPVRLCRPLCHWLSLAQQTASPPTQPLTPRTETSHPILLSLTCFLYNPVQVIGMSPLNDYSNISTHISASVLATLLFAVHTDASPVDLKLKSDHIAIVHEALPRHRQANPDLPSRPYSLWLQPSPLNLLPSFLVSLHSGIRLFFVPRGLCTFLLGMLFSEIFKWPFSLIWGLNWNDAT